MPTKRQLAEADRLAREVDWSRIRSLTDAEIEAAARADADAVLPTEEELKDFRLVTPRKRRGPPAAAE